MISHLRLCRRSLYTATNIRIRRRCDVMPRISVGSSIQHPPHFASRIRTIRTRSGHYRPFSSSLHHFSSEDEETNLLHNENTPPQKKDLLLSAFARQTDNNVQVILSFLENKLTKSGNTIHLSNRWRKLNAIERGRNYRRNKTVQNNLTIEELWEEALAEESIPFMDPGVLSPPLSDVDQETEGHIQSENVSVSPIFGLQLDEEGRITEMDEVSKLESDAESSLDVESILKDAKEENMAKPNGYENLSATLGVIALLNASRKEDWDVLDTTYASSQIDSKVDSTTDENVEDDEVIGEGSLEDLSSIWDDDDDESDSPKGSLDEKVNLRLNDSLNTPEKKSLVKATISDLLEDMESNQYILSTEESNLLLAHMVTSLDESADGILNNTLQLFNQMKTLYMSGQTDSGPDIYTYRLLLLALSRRLSASGEALKLTKDFFASGLEVTPEVYLSFMEVCFERNDLVSAYEILKSSTEQDELFQPPVSTYIWMIDMMKSENLQDQAVRLLNRVHEKHSLSPEEEGRLFVSLCKWPVRSRRGDLIDTTPFLLKILDILERRSKEGSNKPQKKAWTTLITKLWKQAKAGASNWKDVDRAIASFLALYPDYVPDPLLLKQGLDAAEARSDAVVMAEMISRQSENERNATEAERWDSFDGESDSAPRVAAVPQGVFRRSLDVCIRSGNAESGRRILNAFKSVKDEYPEKVQSDVFGLACLCYTSAGQASDAKATLFAMAKSDMKVTEDLVGAVLYSLVVNNQIDEANELFDNMQQLGDSTGTQFTPGTASFDAMILSHMRSKSWDSALELFETMKERNLEPSSQTIQSIILATNQKDGKNSVLSTLEKLLLDYGSSSSFDERTFLLSSRLLLPKPPKSVDGMRSMLREISDTNPSLRKEALDLTRSLRTAQVEEYRKVAQGQPKSRVKPQDDEGTWQRALGYLLAFVRASSPR